MVRFLLLLDEKRRWLPGFMRNRKTEVELTRDERQASKGLGMLSYLQTLTIDELEERFAESTEPRFKELIRMAHSLKRAEHEPADAQLTPSLN